MTTRFSLENTLTLSVVQARGRYLDYLQYRRHCGSAISVGASTGRALHDPEPCRVLGWPQRVW